MYVCTYISVSRKFAVEKRGHDRKSERRKEGELTIHGEHHSLANGRRHVVAGDAEIHPHLSSLDAMELQEGTVVVLVLLESASTCAHVRKRYCRVVFPSLRL